MLRSIHVAVGPVEGVAIALGDLQGAGRPVRSPSRHLPQATLADRSPIQFRDGKVINQRDHSHSGNRPHNSAKCSGGNNQPTDRGFS
jgi:hypothetical protein